MQSLRSAQQSTDSLSDGRKQPKPRCPGRYDSGKLPKSTLRSRHGCSILPSTWRQRDDAHAFSRGRNRDHGSGMVLEGATYRWAIKKISWTFKDDPAPTCSPLLYIHSNGVSMQHANVCFHCANASQKSRISMGIARLRQDCCARRSANSRNLRLAPGYPRADFAAAGNTARALCGPSRDSAARIAASFRPPLPHTAALPLKPRSKPKDLRFQLLRCVLRAQA